MRSFPGGFYTLAMEKIWSGFCDSLVFTAACGGNSKSSYFWTSTMSFILSVVIITGPDSSTLCTRRGYLLCECTLNGVFNAGRSSKIKLCMAILFWSWFGGGHWMQTADASSQTGKGFLNHFNGKYLSMKMKMLFFIIWGGFYAQLKRSLLPRAPKSV